MNKYELTVVLPGKATAAKKKDLLALIEKMVKALGGKVLASNDWGEKDLAYEIDGNPTGAFIYFDIELPAESASELDTKLKHEATIIRYLLVRAEKQKTAQ